MKFLIEDIALSYGVSPQGVALLGAILGMLLIFVGLGLLTSLFTSLRRRAGTSGPAHQLMPTLAEEVLDADLRMIYRRSIQLDARLFNARQPEPTAAETPSDPGHASDTARVGETGSALGRAVRKSLLSVQARRFAKRSPKELGARKNEPPFGEARLVQIKRVLEEAFALNPASLKINPTLDKLTLEVEQARRALDARAADEDLADDSRGDA